MTPPTRIAAVTGGNKVRSFSSLPILCGKVGYLADDIQTSLQGIGLAIVRQLALQYPKSSFNNGPLLIYLTARDQSRGQKAVEDLQSDKQLLSAKALQHDGGLTDIKYAALDIADKKSIEDFAAFLKKEHGQIDFLINNAGVAIDGFGTCRAYVLECCTLQETLKCVMHRLQRGGQDLGNQLLWHPSSLRSHSPPHPQGWSSR